MISRAAIYSFLLLVSPFGHATSVNSDLDKLILDQAKWTEYLRDVLEGESRSLLRWPGLRKASDAGTTEQLDLALTRLISKSPKSVFAVISSGWPKEKERLAILGRVCARTNEESQEQTYPNFEEEKTSMLKLIDQKKRSLARESQMLSKKMRAVCDKELGKAHEYWSNKKQ